MKATALPKRAAGQPAATRLDGPVRQGLLQSLAGAWREMASPRQKTCVPVVEEFEPRLLYSADFAASGLVLAGSPVVEQRLLDPGGEYAAVQAGQAATAEQRCELLIIDSRVPNIDELLAGLDTEGKAIEVVILDAGRDGIEQISAALAGRSDLAAIHVFSHGSAGQLQLGATTLDDRQLDARGTEIARWGDALAGEADILLYGCDVAGSADGEAFVQRLAGLTGADVAASDDYTGNALLGGDWKLEYATGLVEALNIVSQATQENWLGRLEIISGSYVGNAVDNRNITGVGFQPDVVIIKVRDDNKLAVIRSSTMSGDASKELVGGTALTANQVQALQADGFQVGSADEVNKIGKTYDWIAFKSSAGFLTTGTYTGSGGASQAVTGLGFSPDAVFVLSAGGEQAVFTNSAAGGNAFDFDNGTNATWIPSLGADGFTVGADGRVNALGGIYHYVAFNETPGLLDVGSYVGNGADNRNIAGVGFQPEWVVVKDTAGDSVVQHFDSQGAATDSSSLFKGSSFVTNRIQQLQADGFQVGTDNDVNNGGRTYTYMAFRRDVNVAPTATNLSAPETYTEDTALNLTDIVVSDVDSANVTVTLTLSDPAAGSLNTGTSNAVTSTYVPATGVWSASGAIADVNILLAGLTFTPALNYNANFSIATNIGAGVTGSKAMTGLATNDPPTASNLSAAETYFENTPLDLADIAVGDVDSANVTVTLTLSDLAAGSLNTGTSNAVTSTFAAGVWSASGASADVNVLLAGLTFTPAAAYTSNFSIATSVSDGVAAPITGSKAMTGTAAVNVAPTATNLSAAETYTEDTALNLTDIVVSDADSANVTVTLTLSDPAAGSLNTGTSNAVTSTYFAGTGVWSASGAIADVNILLAGLTFTPALNYNGNFSIAASVSDGVAAPITGSKAMTGSATNDPPVASNLSAAETYTEGVALNLIDIVVSDVDSANVTVTLTLSVPAAGSLNTGTSNAVTSTFVAGVWTASGAIADVNTLLAGLTFTPAPSYNGNFAIATSVNDGVAAPITGSKAMTGSATNDPPTASNLSAAETYIEDTALNLIDIVIGDVDSANVNATLTLSDAAAGSLNTATSNGVTSTFAAGVWSATGAIADVNVLLAGLTFTPAPDYNGNFSIATSVTDGVAAAVTGSKAMTGTATNDAPTLSGIAVLTNINDGASATPFSGVTIADVDAPAQTQTVLITLDNAAKGALSNLGGGTYNAATGMYSFSGTAGAATGAVRGLVFTPAANRVAPGSAETTTFTLSVSDGVAPAVTDSGTTVVNTVAPLPTPAPVTPAPLPDQPPAAEPVAEAEVAPERGNVAEQSPAEAVAGSAPAAALPLLDNQTALATGTPAGMAAASSGDRLESSRAGLRLANPIAPYILNPVILADFQLGKIGELPPSEAVTSATESQAFIKELDQLRESVTAEAEGEKLAIGATAAVGTGFSIGYVLWLLRGGVLMSSLMAALPVWRFVDPLPVLGRLKDGDGEEDDEATGEDESLESMVGERVASADAAQPETRQTDARQVPVEVKPRV